MVLVRKRTQNARALDARSRIDAARGFPRTHPESEITRIGPGPHVSVIVTTTAVAISGSGANTDVVLDDADDVHLTPALRAQLRAAPDTPTPPVDPNGGV